MRSLAVLGALNALIAVAAGAFGAHGLRDRLPPDLLSVWETGARYQMYHALGLLVAAWLASRRAPGAEAGGWAMFAGIVVFSGSLYALAFTGVRVLGAITPVGGVAFMVGWALLALAALRMP